MVEAFPTSLRDCFSLFNDSYSTTETDLGSISSVNDYIFTETIGRGSSGKVKLAYKGTKDNLFAVKIFNKEDLKRKREVIKDEKGRPKFRSVYDKLQQEIAIMKELDHPGIVKLHEVIDDPNSPNMFIVMEYVQGGQLLEWDDNNKTFSNRSYTGFLPEENLRLIFNGIIKGLDYLHSKGIIHRDIKPQNILLDKYKRPKIVDFGSAVHLKDPFKDSQKSSEGTRLFMAPEIVGKNIPLDGYSGKAADIWAMGVTFYALTFHCLPFYHDNLLELYDQIETQPVEFPKERKVSDDLKKLLRCLLEKDPKRRMKLKQLKNDSWLNQHDELAVLTDQTNKQKIARAIERFKKSVTLPETEFIKASEELFSKDVKHLRRVDSSEFEFFGEPVKKVHTSD